MLDPLLLRIIALVFAAVFVTASLHKLGNKAEFRAVLSAYRLLPTWSLGLASILIPIIELLLALAWLSSALFLLQFDVTSLASAGLLLIYAFAMGINLARGRSHIDCGCSFSSQASGQQLSIGLLVRNSVLASVALVAGFPIGERALGVTDYFALLAAVIVMLLFYGAVNQLLVNSGNIKSWRNNTKEQANG